MAHYTPNEPRDKNGKWTSDAASQKDKSKHPAHAAMKKQVVAQERKLTFGIGKRDAHKRFGGHYVSVAFGKGPF